MYCPIVLSGTLLWRGHRFFILRGLDTWYRMRIAYKKLDGLNMLVGFNTLAIRPVPIDVDYDSLTRISALAVAFGENIEKIVLDVNTDD